MCFAVSTEELEILTHMEEMRRKADEGKLVEPKPTTAKVHIHSHTHAHTHTHTHTHTPGWKLGQVRRVTFCADQPDQTRTIKNILISTLTALLEYFYLLAHALKVQSCYLFSYHLAS